MQKRSVKIPEEYKYVTVFLTMRCNLECSYCLNNLEKSKDFNRIKFKEISGEQWVKGLNNIELRPEVPITFSGGEPFLHPDFIYIINNLKPELKIDILTNLKWGEYGINKFIEQVNPERLKREAPYPSIRVSYHPEQMKDAEQLVKDAKKLQDAGFSIGIYSVQYPSSEQLEAITKMQFLCRAFGVDFRVKDFTGKFEGKDDKGDFFSITYGDYSKYPDSTFQQQTKACLCRTSDLLIGPDGKVYKCHRDLYSEEFPIGNIIQDEFKIEYISPDKSIIKGGFKIEYISPDKSIIKGGFHPEYIFRKCNKFGQCHPCDVKVKTNYKQELGHTSVEIKFEDNLNQP